MDFSFILILPFSGLVAFAMLTAAFIAGRRAPRLIWPCAISIGVSGLMILRLPTPSTLLLWVFTVFWMSFSAALGTVIGAGAAKIVMAAFRLLRRHQK